MKIYLNSEVSTIELILSSFIIIEITQYVNSVFRFISIFMEAIMDSVERVIQICKERGIPIKKLEQACGFSNGYIRNLKEGKFPAPRLYKVAEFLKVSPEYLMGVSKNTPEEDKLLNMFNQLNKDGQQMILQYTEALLGNPNFTAAFQDPEARRA